MDQQGDTAEDDALKEGHESVVALLVQARGA